MGYSNESHVSIHTPTWGVTGVVGGALGLLGFQSTHLHEVWQQMVGETSTYNGFNPHTYMRCDEVENYYYEMITSFNPHTYMRCDDYKLGSDQNLRVSIHTPTWGVTGGLFKGDNGLKVSIHTPTWGVTTEWINCKIWRKVSIHTPTWGVTQCLSEVWHSTLFQSTHLHEVWQ